MIVSFNYLSIFRPLVWPTLIVCSVQLFNFIMDDLFLHALVIDLEQTQRALPPHCLFCVPQLRSLLVDELVTKDVLYTHFLTTEGLDDESTGRLGEYRTLNGKQVLVLGSHVHTKKGFADRRQVRILLSEKREVHHQIITVLHLSRPLEGGIEIPDDLSEIDVATFRKYTAILRSYPENELVFYQLNATINQVHKICAQEKVYERYKETLPARLRQEWEAAVDDLVHAGSLDNVEKDDQIQRNRGGEENHLLQLQQVVECYLMENLHDLIFPRVVASCYDMDKKLHHIMYRMRHYTPEDFGLRKEFQCFAAEARDTLLTVVEKKTPLQMLLVLKTCIDQVSDAITRNIKLHRLDSDAYQLTTDDILDQLLFVVLLAFYHVTHRSTEMDGCPASFFPIVAVLKYISDYHFINSNTTALGFTIANFQVAIEYFLKREDHNDECKDCSKLALQDVNAESCCLQMIAESNCVRAAHTIQRDLMKAVENGELARRDARTATEQNCSSVVFGSTRDVLSMRSILIIGEWSLPIYDSREVEADASSGDLLAVHPVEFVVNGEISTKSGTNVLQVSGGQRFFASVMEDGKLFMWGDSSGGRLGYALVDGDSRRVNRPQQVSTLDQQTITQVACGAFHTLATDINGHVFAWGSNSRGQLGFLSPGTSAITVETPAVIGALRGMYISSVACGEYHSLALSSHGCIFSWGCNKYGKLGRTAEGLLEMAKPSLLDADWTGRAMDTKSRIRSGERSVVSRIAAGKDHSLAISSDGAVFTWGRGDSGQLGHGCYMDVTEPMQVMAISAAGLVDVAGGNNFSLFLVENGTTYICGRDPSLDGDTLLLSPSLLLLPSQLEHKFSEQIVSVSCGEMHYALLSKCGALLVSFGSILQPLPDDGSTTTDLQERRIAWVKAAGTVRQMTCGASHTIVVA